MMKPVQRLLYKVCVSCRPNKSRTVRYAFPIAFVAVAFLGAAALLTQGSSYIRIVTDNSLVSAGEFFSVDIYAGANVPVNTVDIAVEFPADQVEIEGIDTGQSVITIWTEEPYVERNKVIFRGGTFRRGFVGEHLVGSINARAKESGTAKFTVGSKQFLAGDGRGSTVTIKDTGYESLTMYVDVAPDANDPTAAGSLGGELTLGIYTDINGDGSVDLHDILSFMGAWRSQDTTYDFNGDGRMTFVDFAIILADSFFR